MTKTAGKLFFAYSVLLFALLPLSLAAQLFVTVNGNDHNPGTKEQPLASIAKALRKARELRRLADPSIKNGIHILLGDGRHQVDEPVIIKAEDAGTETSPTIIEAAPGAKAVISGGINIRGWKKAAGNIEGLPVGSKGKLWVANAPVVGGRLQAFRQLWVNNRKAVRARSTKGDEMQRILSWDHETETCWIPRPVTDINALEGLEMFIHQWWAVAILRVKSVEVEKDRAKLSFHQPESRIQSEHPWPAPWISKETGNSAFFLMNAIQFLDEPGEWFLDMKNRKVYYYPRADESLTHADVVAPVLETVLKIEGSIDKPVTNVSFNGISFMHTSWLRPSTHGHVPHQAGMYMLEAYKLHQPGTAEKGSLENQAWVGRPAAAVTVSYARETNFINCRFEHLASTGLDFHKGTRNSNITGNLFKDIGGAAILAGVFSDEAVEVHLPYHPSDEREISGNLLIANNLVNNVSNEDWGTVGIGAGYVKHVTIAHNDISELSYTGISLGWGWTRALNAMQDNKIMANKIQRYARHMYDVAGIYTLSAQPGTMINANYIDSAYKAPYAHLPSHWFYIYTDEGSSYMTVKDNWTPSEKFLQNANGPGNTWQNNGPQVHDSIRRNAGLEPRFNALLKEKKMINKQVGIVHEQPNIIEIIVDYKSSFTHAQLKQVLQESNSRTASIYKSENRYVVFGKVQDVSVLAGKIANRFTGVEVKAYHDLFYEFNRRLCADTATATTWEHVILTANLVADVKLQKEYLDYHAQQFEKWPEVSNGFCNASFQQLLIYRNGRQLMLVISIPKGKTLDELNPRTTENNPKVEAWNKLMKKYQEGIAGTRPGEVWVELKKID